MGKILTFFGAFNPPTLAHIKLAEKAMRDTGSSGVMFVLSKSDYILNKQLKDFAFDDSERLSLLNDIAAARPWMSVCGWELNQPKQPRTYITLCHLRDEGFSPRLLVGSDKLKELSDKWVYVDEIAQEFGVVAIERGGDDARAIIEESPRLSRLKEHIRVVEAPEDLKFVSSSLVREKLRLIRDTRAELTQLVPEETINRMLYDFIKEGTV